MWRKPQPFVSPWDRMDRVRAWYEMSVLAGVASVAVAAVNGVPSAAEVLAAPAQGHTVEQFAGGLVRFWPLIAMAAAGVWWAAILWTQMRSNARAIAKLEDRFDERRRGNHDTEGHGR